ncbi:uncharacterized protein N7458_000345, partial [Penicillium daleae]
ILLSKSSKLANPKNYNIEVNRDPEKAIYPASSLGKPSGRSPSLIADPIVNSSAEQLNDESGQKKGSKSLPLKTIIDNSSRYIKPGKILLILRNLGAGYIILLSVLLNYRNSFVEITSNVSFGSITSQEAKQYRISNTIDFAIYLKVPFYLLPDIKNEEDITYIKDTKVGDKFIRSVSGSKRKQVSILEYLTTRGSFDKILILDNSKQIFYGPRDKAILYIEDLSFIYDPIANKSDFLTSVSAPTIRIITTDFKDRFPRLIEELLATYNNLPIKLRIIAKLDYPNSPEAYYGVRSIFLLGIDGYYILISDPLEQQALIGSSLFYNTPDNIAGLFIKGGLLFFSLLYPTFIALAEITDSFVGRPVLAKYRDFALYYLSAFLFKFISAAFPNFDVATKASRFTIVATFIYTRYIIPKPDIYPYLRVRSITREQVLRLGDRQVYTGVRSTPPRAIEKPSENSGSDSEKSDATIDNQVKNLTYTVKTPYSDRVLLDNIQGFIKPGLIISIKLIAKPSILIFLDEPTSSLDSQAINNTSSKTVYFSDIGYYTRTVKKYFANYSTPYPRKANPAKHIIKVKQVKLITHRINISLFRNTEYINNKLIFRLVTALAISSNASSRSLVSYLLPLVLSPSFSLSLSIVVIYIRRARRRVLFVTSLIVSKLPYLVVYSSTFFVVMFYKILYTGIRQSIAALYYLDPFNYLFGAFLIFTTFSVDITYERGKLTVFNPPINEIYRRSTNLLNLDATENYKVYRYTTR